MKSWPSFVHPYPYLLMMASFAIIVINVIASLDKIHFPQLWSATFSAEPTANPTRDIVEATKVVHTLSNSPKELIHGASNLKKTSVKLSSRNIKATGRATTPVYLEANQSYCDRNIKFMPARSMPLVALVSAPGSGNTWLRYLIEKVTGIYTGSVYDDVSLWKGGFLGETENPRSGRVVVVKMHNILTMEAELDGIILLIRNPYSAIVADFNRLASRGNHKGTAPAGAFNSTYWPLFAKCSAHRWQTIALSCVETFHKKLVVYYEDLQSDMAHQLRRIVSFLGLPMDDQKLKCTLQNTEGNFHRSNHLDADPFTLSLTAAVDATIGDLQEAFHFYKYEVESLKAYRRNNSTSLASYSPMFFGDVCNQILRPV